MCPPVVVRFLAVDGTILGAFVEFVLLGRGDVVKDDGSVIKVADPLGKEDGTVLGI
jgi:hypothetical protein